MSGFRLNSSKSVQLSLHAVFSLIRQRYDKSDISAQRTAAWLRVHAASGTLPGNSVRSRRRRLVVRRGAGPQRSRAYNHGRLRLCGGQQYQPPASGPCRYRGAPQGWSDARTAAADKSADRGRGRLLSV